MSHLPDVLRESIAKREAGRLAKWETELRVKRDMDLWRGMVACVKRSDKAHRRERTCAVPLYKL